MNIKQKSSCKYDLISLGEVMLRLDPGDGRVRTTRQFQAWEGGGEYNVARGLKRCFGMKTGIVTALVDNEVGRLVEDLPNFQAVATTLRNAKTATVNDWGAVLYTGGEFYEAAKRPDLEIFDRVGGGDSFASGLIYGFMTNKTPEECVNYGAAHGAFAMTTPGDTSMASLAEVKKIVAGAGARVDR